MLKRYAKLAGNPGSPSAQAERTAGREWFLRWSFAQHKQRRIG
jgi:hypothetical protein